MTHTTINTLRGKSGQRCTVYPAKPGTNFKAGGGYCQIETWSGSEPTGNSGMLTAFYSWIDAACFIQSFLYGTAQKDMTQ